MRRFKFYLIIGVLFYSCAGSSTGPKPRRNLNVITAEEIAQSNVTKSVENAYDVIKYLRPSFLRVRSTSTTRLPVVYLDNMRIGGIDELNHIMVERIAKIQYLNPGDATMRFGLNHAGGAILVLSK